MKNDFDMLSDRLREFARERDWEQFHNPKNLAMALIVEAAELTEHFQWLTPEQARTLPEKQKKEVALEMADIMIYLSRLSERLGIDLLAATNEKIAINEKRFPPIVANGSRENHPEN
jgi:dCTP diphosphatase